VSSCLYECRVLHHRFTPKVHRFVYRLFYFAIDLDELPALRRRLWFFSDRRPNVFRFRDRDFLPLGGPVHQPTGPTPALAPATPLKERVLAFLRHHGVDPGPEAKVLLITLPRLFGYQFNPISLYFCRDRTGRTVAAIVEVTNTFREAKPYLILPDARGRLHRRTPKHFYVSPFSPLDYDFDFTLSEPGRRLAVRIDDYAGSERVLHSTLGGQRTPLTNRALAWFLLKYPWVTVKIMALIHWQALRLWLRRVPWFAKAAGADRQRDVYRPHPSIASSPRS
jgi:DUF1365 family protein